MINLKKILCCLPNNHMMSRMDKNQLLQMYQHVESGDLLALEYILKDNSFLIAASENGENSLLLRAADNGNFEICQLLIKHGADVNYRSDIGETALSCAIIIKDVRLIKFLLAQGATVDKKENDRSVFVSIETLANNSTEEIQKIIAPYLKAS